LDNFIFGDKYIPVSDIACERQRAKADTDGIEFKIESGEGFVWERLKITTKDGAANIGRPIGRYDTLNLGAVHMLCELDIDEAKNEISKELCALISELGVFPDKILVVGLGNDKLTPDSVGPKCASLIRATRHTALCEDSECEFPECSEIACIAPGVSQDSGIESFEIISGLTDRLKPNFIIAVDSIATASEERLGKCIQICDTGIAPGSGVGGRRMLLNKRTLGIPVIAIGAPTVINSKLLKPQKKDPESKDRTEELFLSPREIDLITDAFAVIIAGAINQAFGIF
jgi:spore protease